MRLSIAKLVTGDYNALFLDEPTNYLDIRSLEAVERVLLDYPGTILFVSHDRAFVERVATEELVIADYRVAPVTREQALPSSVSRTRLEMRKVQILGELSGANEEKRAELEAEYARVVGELNGLAPG
jgi:ATPase subunit of ABC transporter with duplicated ATPase domains